MKREYEEVLRKVGIRVLDVYRFRDRDVVRLLFKGKMHLVDLKRFYDSMKPEELVSFLLSQLT